MRVAGDARRSFRRKNEWGVNIFFERVEMETNISMMKKVKKMFSEMTQSTQKPP